ncbi:hypothetical protein KBX21_09900 [Nocardiopsis sp. B62]|nr:hypothetical protein [Nocardiopsis sp. B62]
MTDTYEYTRAWTESLRAEGRAEGLAEAKSESVLRVLEARGKSPDDAARERIAACRDLGQLDVWFDRALSVDSVDEVLRD